MVSAWKKARQSLPYVFPYTETLFVLGGKVIFEVNKEIMTSQISCGEKQKRVSHYPQHNRKGNIRSVLKYLLDISVLHSLASILLHFYLLWFMNLTPGYRPFLSTYCRLDTVCRESPFQSSDSIYLHCKITTTDHGLPCKGLFCQTAGKESQCFFRLITYSRNDFSCTAVWR